MPPSIADRVAQILAPVGGGSFPRAYDRLAGTGTTEDSLATALTSNKIATLLVGATAVRVSFRAATGGSTQVATTDPIIAANQQFHWLVDDNTCVVYVEAADGSSAYECWIWESSP